MLGKHVVFWRGPLKLNVPRHHLGLVQAWALTELTGARA